MEDKLLADVFDNDLHVRLDAGERLTDYFRKPENSPDAFPDLERLIGGLANWLSSSNFKLNMCALDVFSALVLKMGDTFKPHIATVLPALREKLGDSKDQVRDQSQLLIQQIMQSVSGTPQNLLDRLLEVGFAHKNWRVKEQSLICLTRTLNYFGSGQISVAKFVGHICTLLGDANSQVRTCAVDTLVDIYSHVGVKVRIDLSKRGLPAQKLNMLNAKFDEVDGSHGNVANDQEDDANSFSSNSSSNLSSASAQALPSAQSGGVSRPQAIPRPSSVNRMTSLCAATPTSGSGAVTESDFEKAFTDVPHVNIFTQSDLEKAMNKVAEVTGNTANSWDVRVNSLKELRSIVSYESLDLQVLVGLLKIVESPMLTSLKDLRSQVTREACVTISYLATLLGLSFSHFAEQMLPQLIALLPNSAKVMASSAEVCIKFLLKHTHSHRLLQPISLGLQSKSSITKKQCAECFFYALRCWETSVVEKGATVVEECVCRAISDADATTRKHIRRAFWTYHRHLPSLADRLFASFDPQIQKHLSEERVAMESHAPTGLPPMGSASSILKAKKRLPVKSDADASGYSDNSEALKKVLTCIANVRPEGAFQPPTLSSTLSLPIIKVQQPTVRRKPPRLAQEKMSQSVEDLTQAEPLPPSPQVIKRPQSRAVMTTDKRSDLLPSKIATPIKRPRSTNPSPSVSREPSPPRLTSRTSASLPHKTAPFIADMDKLTKALTLSHEADRGYNGGDYEDDDDGSVASERSTFSITSEVSVSPYVKYSNPIEDLNELASLCSRPQWSDRRDGIAQLHMLLEGEKPLSHNDMLKVKGIFRKMFSEPHTKVFGMFLDALSGFVEQHKEYLDDFLFLMLLRLLHRQGTDMLSSVHYKLMAVLELIRKNFEPEQQFVTLGRILTDPQQPMSTKVKLAWMEYFLEVIAQMEPSDFKDDVDTQQMVVRLLDMTTDTSSMELRRNAQKAVVGLFDLNTSSLSLLIRNVPKKQQDDADRIIKAHLQEAPTSGDEEVSTQKRPESRAKVASSPAVQRSKSPSQSKLLGTREPLRAVPGPVPRPSSRNAENHLSASLTSSRMMCSSSPDLTSVGASSTRSLIPIPSTTPVGSPNMSRIPMLRRPNSTTPGKSTTPQANRKGIAPQGGGVRSASVDPERMSERSQAPPPPRPSSVRSHSSLKVLRAGSSEMEDIKEGSSPSNSAASSQFSFSDLTKLDFGSPENGGPPPPGAPPLSAGVDRDEVDLIVAELTSAPSSKLRCLALQSLLTFCREYPNKCSWDKNFRPTMKGLIGQLEDEEPPTRTMALRVIREILKTQSTRMGEFAEPLTLKVLLSFAHNDTSVSQAAEDIFTLLAPALPNESTLLLLIPMAAKEKYPMLLGVIKFLTKVVTLSKDEFLSQHLSALVPSVVKGYCHSDSSVRKSSVFCLVAIHAVVGEKIREYLSRLTSSQVKLLDLYIKRHQQGSAPQ